LQILFELAGIALFCLALWKKPSSSVLISLGLSLLWLWNGICYHWIFFSPINPAAIVFGAFFCLQGILFLYAGVVKRGLSFRLRPNLYGVTGSAMLVFSLVLYPVIGYFAGHRFPQAPTFGLPCPSTIFTFGMMLCLERRLPALILIIPVAWSILGFTAAFSFGVVEDTGLVISGLITVALTFLKNRRVRLETLLAPTEPGSEGK
jgi:hypothetical protein